MAMKVKNKERKETISTLVSAVKKLAIDELEAFDYEEYSEEDEPVPDISSIDLTDYYNFPVRRNNLQFFYSFLVLSSIIPIQDSKNSHLCMEIVQKSLYLFFCCHCT